MPISHLANGLHTKVLSLSAWLTVHQFFPPIGMIVSSADVLQAAPIGSVMVPVLTLDRRSEPVIVVNELRILCKAGTNHPDIAALGVIVSEGIDYRMDNWRVRSQRNQQIRLMH